MKQKCPNCNSVKTAEIVYGYIMIDDKIQKLLNSEQIILGGCIITDNDPAWFCNDCKNRFGNREEL